jgi:putative ABC transport system permease protein
MHPERPRLTDRILKFFVRLFPFDFRADHGREIEQTFHAQERDAAREGKAGLWRLWAEFIAGIFQTAPREHLSILRQDATYAIRRMRQNPGFSAVIVLTLALGIGANTAIFSVVNGVLLRPLPYGEGERLVRVWQEAPKINILNAGHSEKEILDLQRQNRTLDGIVEYHSMVFILIGAEPHRVQTGVVSPEFFDFFGVKTLAGRTFRAEDNVHGTEGVLILSHPFWQRVFAGDPTVVGRVLQMNNRPHTVVGILPPLPQYPDENDVYMPVSHCPFRSSQQTRENRRARMSTVFARLKPGVTLQQAQADLRVISSSWQAEYPDAYPRNAEITSSAARLKDELTRDARNTFFVLLATAGFVLLIACANVANLTLSRVVHRERELAIRSALGANRGRLVRQLLTESAILSLAGGALALVMASATLDLLVNFASRFTPRTGEISIDASVLLFTLGASLLTGLIFGSLPALAAGTDLTNSLKEGGGRATMGTARHRARNVLIVVQVAFSLILLTGAGLMLRSFVKLLQVQPGYNPENVLAARISLNFSKFSDPDIRKAQQKQRAFYENVLRNLESHPGVVASAVASVYPMMPGVQFFDSAIQVEGKIVPEDQPAPRATIITVTPEYFRAVGIPLARGRVFEERDKDEAELVAVISQSTARHHWGDEDPIGRRIGWGNPIVWRQVVGVVGDVKEFGPAQNTPLGIYQPYAQGGFVSRVVLRSTDDPLRMVETLRNAVRQVDPEQPVDQFRTLEQARGDIVAAPRLTTLLLGIFGSLALVITATGITGVLALSVSQRTHEIGIRMALGATPGDVNGMILRQGMQLVLVGMALGVAGSVALTRAISGLLFGIEPGDPLTFVGVSALLIFVAAVACLIPARRAASIEPMLALRTE